MNAVEMHAIIHGNVQGVFFRDTTKRKASQMGISGTVKNLRDGTVEIFAVGEKEKLESLMDYLSSEKGPGEVNNTEVTFGEPSRSYDGFQVIY